MTSSTETEKQEMITSAKSQSLIPVPTSITAASGTHRISPDSLIIAPGELQKLGAYLQDTLYHSIGKRLDLTPDADADADKHRISLQLLRETREFPGSSESYQLKITEMEVGIAAKSPVGIFYGIQTLLQLLPPAVFSSNPRYDLDWLVPCMTIEDAPRFSWRGAMLDCARHFFPLSYIKKFIDLLAMHKLNIFHWHLTNDQGWRIEIKKYPKLTEIGSKRTGTIRGHLDFQMEDDDIPVEGFYTQEQVREIIAYASERFITVVPEIEMPGHAQAAIAAYPELGCIKEKVEVCTRTGIMDMIFNVEESTFVFLEDVLKEVLDLFPGEFIHVGGDEAIKTQWENSPQVQARMKELGITDTHALQSYFIGRMEKFLSRHGRKLIGWDEILEGGLPAGATVMSWRGAQGGIEAANSGHDVIMASNGFAYLDYYQSKKTEEEPMGIGNFISLQDSYNGEVIPGNISRDKAQHILGVQGQLWTEYIKNSSHLEYMAFPRLCALAEIAWSPEGKHDFRDFMQRLKPHLKRLDILNVRYRPPLEFL